MWELVTLSATELFIHWFRPNFSDLVYNGHHGSDTFTPDRNLQLLWFQVVIHPLNIPEKGGKGDVESFLFWYQSCSCSCAWQIFHINNFLLPRSWRFERLYSVWFCFSARSEFPTEIGFWGFWIGGLSFVIRRSRSGQRRWRFARVLAPALPWTLVCDLLLIAVHFTIWIIHSQSLCSSHLQPPVWNTEIIVWGENLAEWEF